jgi:diguanylate cyclase (GGDEF)-like protein
MSKHQKIEAAIPAAQLTPEVCAAFGQLSDENALLRASLSQMRDRLFELEDGADRDTLTPLPNRRCFLRELERVVSKANRHGTPAAILYVDMAGLKELNDRHGHFAGDSAIIHVARLLAGLIRSTDVAARISGDEFGLILDHLDHNSAIETGERIAKCISERPLDIGGALVTVEVAVGTATILPGDSVDDVLKRAERIMERTKTGN